MAEAGSRRDLAERSICAILERALNNNDAVMAMCAQDTLERLRSSWVVLDRGSDIHSPPQ